MTVYDLEHILAMLRDATDFAEIEKDFVPLRKWLIELEKAIESNESKS